MGYRRYGLSQTREALGRSGKAIFGNAWQGWELPGAVSLHHVGEQGSTILGWRRICRKTGRRTVSVARKRVSKEVVSNEVAAQPRDDRSGARVGLSESHVVADAGTEIPRSSENWKLVNFLMCRYSSTVEYGASHQKHKFHTTARGSSDALRLWKQRHLRADVRPSKVKRCSQAQKVAESRFVAYEYSLLMVSSVSTTAQGSLLLINAQSRPTKYFLATTSNLYTAHNARNVAEDQQIPQLKTLSTTVSHHHTRCMMAHAFLT